MKCLTSILLFIISFSASRAQTESVHLHIDKTICYAADTLWFSAYIFDNNHPSSLSVNLYVELYNDSNILCSRKTFPINNSISIGQLETPTKPGLYWIRSYTRNSSYFLQSLTIRGIENKVVVRKLLDYKEAPAATEVSGILISSAYGKDGILSSMFPKSGSKYNDKPFELILKYYGSTIGKYPFILKKERQRSILISQDSLRGYVRGYVSLLFYNADTLVAQQAVFIPSPKYTPIEIRKDNMGYVIKLKDNYSCWNYSLAVVNSTIGDNPTDIRHCLSPPGKIREIDTSFLAYQGVVNNLSGRGSLIKNRDLVFMLQKDSFTNIKLIRLDSAGNFLLSRLFFYDTASIHYMLNGWYGDKLNDIRLTLSKPDYPEFVPPVPSDYEWDTLNIPASLTLPSWDAHAYLKPVIVTADSRKELEHRYTTSKFAWPAHFSFDLANRPIYDYQILEYLKRELPWFAWADFGKPPAFKGKPVVFYLDEQVINWRDLIVTHVHDLAYMKVIEDFPEDDPSIRMVSGISQDVLPGIKDPGSIDNSPAAMICMYSRRGKDLRLIPGKFNTISIKGYDRPLIWRLPDRTTLFWAPYINNNFRFNLPFSDGHSFKIVIEGVNKAGEVFHFEEKIN